MNKNDRNDIAKWIYESKDYKLMIPYDKYPEPGRYVVTGLQMGNIHGERGYINYIGYVVQVRIKGGAYGMDLIILRHPDGSLCRHENQSYFYMSESHEKLAKTIFKKGVTPDKMEDYTQPYTLGDKYPATGKIIDHDTGYRPDNSPLMQITIDKGDKGKEIIVC